MDEKFILLGCEESQEVCIAFRKLGFNAFSCDLQECSGGHPEWHLQMDVFVAIRDAVRGGNLVTQSGDVVFIKKWHLGIFFPTCTYLTVSANKWFKDQPERKSGTLVGAARRQAREEAILFVKKLYNCGIKKVAIENPIGVLSTEFMPPTQVIQPWMFGHGETKATCLWLRNLPKLVWTDRDNLFEQRTSVNGREQRIFKLPKTEDRAKIRSKTFPGIAQAMAKQWGEHLEQTLLKTKTW